MSEALARLATLGTRLEQLKDERQQVMEEVSSIVREHRDDIALRQMALATGLSRTTIYKMLEES